MGWVVGFEPTYTGATTLGLNHLTIPTTDLATWNGLEPSTSSVTGWHSNQLNYQAAYAAKALKMVAAIGVEPMTFRV